VAYSGTFPAGTTVRETVSLTIGGKSRDVLVYRPPTAGANAPLFILFHGTGGDPTQFMNEVGASPVADAKGFIVALPKANRPQQGPADVDHWEATTYDSGWNLSDTNPATNDDVLLTRAIIDAASQAYGIDRKRVYTGGMSNGAFFSPMVALLLPNEIAGFSEQSGGAIRCENRGKNGEQWTAKGTDCATIAKESGFPACSGQPLKPVAVPTSGRIPRGFLAHNNADPIVSVAWTCHLAEAMGSNATTHIVAGSVHWYQATHIEEAWNALSATSLP
jgi:poly(3-hydroxybutyrate) depolymerase